jgi:hypothetical protein
MIRNVNLDAHFSALLFLGSAVLLALLLISFVVLAIRSRPRQRYAITGLLLLILGYGLSLVGFALFSRERTLARGEEKYFCELDCHLAYSVQKVERVKNIGSANASGEFYIVTVRVRFDESTTAPWRRRDAPLTPVPLNFAVVDSQGRAIQRSLIGQSAWDENPGSSRSLRDTLLPGESYETTLVFDVPADAGSPRLLASFTVFPTQVLIGDENSPLHKKAYFGL